MNKIVCVIFTVIMAGAAYAQEPLPPYPPAYAGEEFIVTLTKEGVLQIWNDRLEIVCVRSSSSRATSFRTNGEKLYVGTQTGKIELYRNITSPPPVKLAKPDFTYPASKSPITAVGEHRGYVFAGDRSGAVFHEQPGGKFKIIGGHANSMITQLESYAGKLFSMADGGQPPRYWTGRRVSAYYYTGGEGVVNAVTIAGKNRNAFAVVSTSVDKHSVEVVIGGAKRTFPLGETLPNVINCAFSPDAISKYLALATYDGVAIIDTATGAEITRQLGMGPVSLAYGPRIAVWDGKNLRFFMGGPQKPTATLVVKTHVATNITVNGEKFEVVAGQENRINVNVGEFLIGHDQNFSLKPQSGRDIKNYLDDEEVYTVSLEEKAPAPTKDPPVKPGVVSAKIEDALKPELVVMSSRKTYAVFDTSLYVIDAGTGIVSAITVPANVNAVAVSPDEKKIFASAGNSIAVIGESEIQDEVSFDGHITAFDSDGKIIVAAVGRMIHRYSLNEKTHLPPIPFSAEITSVSIFDGKILAGAKNGDAAIINAESGEFLPRIFSLRPFPVSAVAWLNNGTACYATAGYNDGYVCSKEVLTSVILFTVRKNSSIRALNSSGMRLAVTFPGNVEMYDFSAGNESTAVFDDNDGELLAAYPNNRIVRASPGGLVFYSGGKLKARFSAYQNNQWLITSAPVNGSNKYSASSEEAEKNIRLTLDGTTGTLDEESRARYRVEKLSF